LVEKDLIQFSIYYGEKIFTARCYA